MGRAGTLSMETEQLRWKTPDADIWELLARQLFILPALSNQQVGQPGSVDTRAQFSGQQWKDRGRKDNGLPPPVFGDKACNSIRRILYSAKCQLWGRAKSRYLQISRAGTITSYIPCLWNFWWMCSIFSWEERGKEKEKFPGMVIQQSAWVTTVPGDSPNWNRKSERNFQSPLDGTLRENWAAELHNVLHILKAIGFW